MGGRDTRPAHGTGPGANHGCRPVHNALLPEAAGEYGPRPGCPQMQTAVRGAEGCVSSVIVVVEALPVRHSLAAQREVGDNRGMIAAKVERLVIQVFAG
jgi:hypothetical protein